MKIPKYNVLRGQKTSASWGFPNGPVMVGHSFQTVSRKTEHAIRERFEMLRQHRVLERRRETTNHPPFFYYVRLQPVPKTRRHCVFKH